MARLQWAGLSCVLASLLIGNAYANDDNVALDMEFLEFLGEGKSVDGQYHDPLQMQDLVEKEVVNAGQQQEGSEHE